MSRLEGLRMTGTDSERVDVLLLGQHLASRQALACALKERFGTGKVVQHGTGKDAIDIYQDARFDAIVFDGTKLPDCDCWRFLRMIRSGDFGLASTAAFILIPPHEQEALSGLVDPYSNLVTAESPEVAVETIAALRKSAPRKTLLLVEDDKTAADAAARILSKLYNVDVCHDGESGLNTWRAKHHQLLVLDLMLPGISGEQVLRQVAAESSQQEDRYTPAFVILTAQGTPERHRELVLAGASAFITKPANLVHLANVCSTVLHERSLLIAMNRADTTAFNLQRLAERVEAAKHTLQRGRTGEATLHLLHAQSFMPAKQMNDDQWAELLQEFPPEPNG